MKKGIQSNDKAVMEATLLGEINSKIKPGEGNSSTKPLQTCW